MTKRFGNASKLAVIGLAVAAAVAMPLSASAHDHDDYRGWHGGYHDYDGGYRHGYWSGGHWIAGAIVTGAVAGLVSNALRPAPVYYEAPVVYGPPRTVIYEDAPIVRRRVVETRTVVYGDPYQMRYVGGYGDDDDDD